jgi:uncharacterized protein (TIGR02266 family)
MMPAFAMRRAYDRVPVHVEVTFESEHNFYTGISNDISEGGVFVASFMPPPVGTMVELSLTLPGSTEVFRAMGIVRWVREYKGSSYGHPAGCGIEWVDLCDRALVLVHRFINSRETILYETV